MAGKASSSHARRFAIICICLVLLLFSSRWPVRCTKYRVFADTENPTEITTTKIMPDQTLWLPWFMLSDQNPFTPGTDGGIRCRGFSNPTPDLARLLDAAYYEIYKKEFQDCTTEVNVYEDKEKKSQLIVDIKYAEKDLLRNVCVEYRTLFRRMAVWVLVQITKIVMFLLVLLLLLCIVFLLFLLFLQQLD